MGSFSPTVFSASMFFSGGTDTFYGESYNDVWYVPNIFAKLSASVVMTYAAPWSPRAGHGIFFWTQGWVLIYGGVSFDNGVAALADKSVWFSTDSGATWGAVQARGLNPTPREFSCFFAEWNTVTSPSTLSLYALAGAGFNGTATNTLDVLTVTTNAF
jgi:hypothetical protein